MEESAGAVIKIFFCKQGFQKNCAKFTKEFPCWSLFLTKFQVLRPATLLTRKPQLYRNQPVDLKSKSMDRLMIGASVMKELKSDSSKSVSCELYQVFNINFIIVRRQQIYFIIVFSYAAISNFDWMFFIQLIC